MSNTTNAVREEISKRIKNAGVNYTQSKPLKDEAKQRLFRKLSAFHSTVTDLGEKTDRAIALVK